MEGKHLRGSKGGRAKKIALTVLALALLAVFLVSSTVVVTQLLRQKREKDAFDALASRVPSRPAPPATQPPETESTGPDPTEGRDATVPTAPPATEAATVPPTEPPKDPTPEDLYGELAAENSDLFGWISIPDTSINYPVMYTPEKPEYYLRRAFDKTRSTGGTPFMDGGCFQGCGNYIIYGHKMQNGTMFADLLKYAKKDFWEEHPIIHFDTLTEFGDYEVLGAFYSRVYDILDGDDVFRYYLYKDLTEEDVFNEYVKKVRAASRYKTGVEAHFGDQLLTLTTCSYHTEDGRFVVVARRIIY